VKLEKAEGALLGQADGQDVGVDLYLVAVKNVSPFNCLSAYHNRFFIFSVLQNCKVNRLIELEKHCGVKFGIDVVPSEFKHEIRVEYGICRALDYLSAKASLKEAG